VGPEVTSQDGVNGLNVYVVKCRTALLFAVIISWEKEYTSFTQAGQWRQANQFNSTGLLTKIVNSIHQTTKNI